ncbi:MAG: UbiA family prenyltransferase [Thiohalomonadaceae bacterium]
MIIADWYRQSLPYLYLCRLHRPTDLLLLLIPAIWASLLASGGDLQWGPMLALLLAASLVRCAMWILADWQDSRLATDASESFIAQQLVSLRHAQHLFLLLWGLALLLLLPLGGKLLLLASAAPLFALGLFWIRTRLYLTQLWLGLAIAWLVPMAWLAQGVWPNKGGWLLFTAVALWASAYTTLYALPRAPYEQRLGIRSLAQLFDEHNWLFFLLLQSAAIFSLWLAGQQLALGLFYSLGLVVALLLLLWQLWLLLSTPGRGALRCYHHQSWTGIAIGCGIAFDYLCKGSLG